MTLRVFRITASITLTLVAPWIIPFLTPSEAWANDGASWRATAPHIEVELLTQGYSSEGIANNDELPRTQLAINFIPEEHWHVYWLNPGDTGLAPKVEWQLPEGATISNFSWGFPHYIPIEHLVNIGYENQLLLPATIRWDKTPEPTAKIVADISWLVCKEACIPGSATLTSPIYSQTPQSGVEGSDNAALSQQLKRWSPRIPLALDVLAAKAAVKKDLLEIQVFAAQASFANALSIDVFVEEAELVKYSAPRKVRWQNNWLLWRQNLSEYFKDLPEHINIVIVLDKKRAYKLRVDVAA